MNLKIDTIYHIIKIRLQIARSISHKRYARLYKNLHNCGAVVMKADLTEHFLSAGTVVFSVWVLTHFIPTRDFHGQDSGYHPHFTAEEADRRFGHLPKAAGRWQSWGRSPVAGCRQGEHSQPCTLLLHATGSEPGLHSLRTARAL